MKEKTITVKQTTGEIKSGNVVAKKSAKKNWGFKFALYSTLLLLFLFIIGGLTGYVFRAEIKSEVCEIDFGRVMIEDALKLGSCDETAESDSDEDDQETFSIQLGADEESIDKITNVSDIFELANPAVVGIGMVESDSTTDNVIGSGFVVSPDGLIATNQHVVSDTDAIYFVKLPDDSEVVEVEEIYRDAVNDIALLKVNRDDLQALALADESSVTPGQLVVAIGNPLGELNSTVTSGIVSGINRSVELEAGSFLRSQTRTFEGTIQTDAAINPGNSGGPLLNEKAEVIGINFATISGADNLSFALPVSILKTRLSELNEFGRFRIPYIGISYEQKLIQIGSDVYVGALIGDMDEEGSAAEVLELGDVVIEVDGISLDKQALSDIVQRQEIGDFVEFELVRDGERVIELVEIIEREE